MLRARISADKAAAAAAEKAAAEKAAAEAAADVPTRPRPPRRRSRSLPAVHRGSATDRQTLLEEIRELLRRRMAESSLFFSAADADESGSIDKKEFRKAIQTIRRDGVPNDIADELFKEFDTDGSGDISYGEYMSYVLRDFLRRHAGRAMEHVKKWDLDGSGSIERWEFRRAMMSMVVAPSIEMIDHLFNEMDEEKSGSLSFKEIARKLQSFGEPRPGGASPTKSALPACVPKGPKDAPAVKAPSPTNKLEQQTAADRESLSGAMAWDESFRGLFARDKPVSSSLQPTPRDRASGLQPQPPSSARTRIENAERSHHNRLRAQVDSGSGGEPSSPRDVSPKSSSPRNRRASLPSAFDGSVRVHQRNATDALPRLQQPEAGGSPPMSLRRPPPPHRATPRSHAEPQQESRSLPMLRPPPQQSGWPSPPMLRASAVRIE